MTLNGRDNVTEKYISTCADGRSPVKRIAAIHDLSCFGRCALTVISPTLSAMGYQVVPVPTCLLSSHTGGFTDMSFLDLTDNMTDVYGHFDRLDLKFDAIYSGFLGNHTQIELVKKFIDRFGSDDTVIFVDPVMGDGGELYSTYTEELMRGMIRLCRGAHVITPNLTEACFLTDTEYANTSDMSEAELYGFAEELCLKLTHTGADKTVITGLHFGKDKLCVCGRDNAAKKTYYYCFDRVNKNYPGTGDLFASVLLGELLKNGDFEASIRIASDFTRRVMDYSSRFSTPDREGVAFEAFLGELTPKSPTV